MYYFLHNPNIAKNIVTTTPNANTQKSVKLDIIFVADINTAIVAAMLPTAITGAKLARRRNNDERNNMAKHNAAKIIFINGSYKRVAISDKTARCRLAVGESKTSRTNCSVEMLRTR